MNIEELHKAKELLADKPIAVLTGAGISTDSGIPDYRGEGTKKRARSPLQYKQFVSEETHRKTYWSRSILGWPKIRACVPNISHKILTKLEEQGRLTGLITQNVDRLHTKAGSKDVVELHGALAEVICLDCRRISERDVFQNRLLKMNPSWMPHVEGIAPDGDIDLKNADTSNFGIPACVSCGGVIKPHVVFFGENVVKDTLDKAWRIFHEAKVLLVVGSSLAVYSGYRFAKEAHKMGKPMVIINIGENRADDLSTVKIAKDIQNTLKNIFHF